MHKLLFILMISLPIAGCANLPLLTGKNSKQAAPVPAWVLSTPADSRDWFWGVGEGPELDTAKRAALKDIAGKLRVSISGQLESQVTVDNNKVDRQAHTRISEEVQKTEFTNYVVDKTAQSEIGFFVLVKVDRQAFIRDQKVKLSALDSSIQQATAGLDNKTPLERFVALRRMQPSLDKAVAYTQVLIGAESGGDGPNRLRKYEALQDQARQAPTKLIFQLQTRQEDNDIAQAVGTYLNESGIRTERSQAGGNILAISSISREDQIYGSKMVKLQVNLSVRDDNGRALSGRDYAVSGSSTYDYRGARQLAIQKLIGAMREAGPIAGLGFVD